MTAIKLNLVKKPYVPAIELPELYQPDKWYIKNWDIYTLANEELQTYWNRYGHTEKPYVDFEECKNEIIRTELKYYMYDCIEKSKINLRTFSDHEARMKYLIEFINQYYPTDTSIIDIHEEDYADFLEKNKYIPATRMKDGTRVNGEMELVAVKRKNRTVSLLSHIQKTIISYNEKHTPEIKKDYWNVKNIPFVKEPCNNYRNLNFKDIDQPFIKEQIKQYCYFKLKASRKTGTIYKHLTDIKTFTHWLYEYYPDHTDFSKLDRDIIEDYFGWLRIESGFTGHQINSCILNLKKFFEDGLLLEYDYFPTKPLVLITDYRFRKVTKAEFYSDEEMKRINKILPEIPTVYAIIIFCLEVLALRISDLVSLTPDMIEIVSNEEKDAGLYKYQLKTNNSISIYLVDSVHTLLMDQYEYSKETYGENVKYIFANGKDSYMAPGSINTEVNKLFYKHKVMGDNGKILRFRSHKFRATKATQLISSGFGAMEGKKALGHSGLQSLSYYANVSTDVVIDSLEPFINKAQTLIENIGKVQNINPDDFKNALPLCNGWCCRPASLGICEHANYCLSCNLFKPDIRHKNYYNIQLLELEATLELAKNSENELLEKKTLKDIKNIKKIIAKVDELCQQKT